MPRTLCKVHARLKAVSARITWTMRVAYAQLLGGAQLKFDSGWIRLQPEKRHQLLTYLAYQSDWVRRDQLAYLFWPDFPDAVARRNLRKAIFHIKALPWLEGLEIEASSLRWSIATDVARFFEAIGKKDWAEVITLYRGPLLTGMDGGTSEAFLGWLTLERERVYESWRHAVMQRVDELHVAQQHSEAAARLKSLLVQDEWDEDALRAYMRALVKADRPEQALRVYQAFAARLDEQLDLEPSLASQALANALQEGARDLTAPPAVAGKANALQAHTLPLAATPFVGRKQELSELTHLLAQPECRLLTLLGAGGAGKSRLAWQAAKLLREDYRDGIVFVPLEALSAAEAISTHIAERLELPLHGHLSPFKQVGDYLANRHTLLILDSFEHLLDAAPQISAWLSTCPALQVLVTSRARLALEEEWLLPVGGLAFPERNVSLEDAHRYDAVELFCQRAQRVTPDFQLSAEQLPGVLEVCHQVEGLPLGLELAAVWVRLMPCTEIAQEIGNNLDFLTSSSRNLPSRHQSVRATFEHSWKLLTPREQDVLRNLSVFWGGFGKEAAKVVAQAPLLVLANLVDKSLLRVTATGRYDRHPLLHQYTREKLMVHAHELSTAQQRHAQYYLHLLAPLNHSQGRVTGALEMLDEELENVLIAWRWFVEGRKVREIERLAEVLAWYFEVRARTQEGSSTLAQATDMLDESDEEQRRTLGKLWARRAWLEHWSNNDEAAEAARQALRLLRPLKEGASIAGALRVLGLIAWRKGDYAEAERAYREALELGEGVLDLRAILLDGLGLILAHRGAYSEAETCYQEALASNERSGDPYQVVHNLVNLASVARRTGKRPEGLALVTRALELATTSGFEHYVPYCLSEMGWLHLSVGAHAEALRDSQRAFELARTVGDTYVQSKALTVSSLTATEMGDLTAALGYLQKGVTVAWSMQDFMLVLQLLCAAAQLEMRRGNLARAAVWAQLVRRHPASPHWCCDQVEALLAQLTPYLPVEVRREAKARALALDLEAAVAEILTPYPAR